MNEVSHLGMKWLQKFEKKFYTLFGFDKPIILCSHVEYVWILPSDCMSDTVDTPVNTAPLQGISKCSDPNSVTQASKCGSHTTLKCWWHQTITHELGDLQSVQQNRLQFYYKTNLYPFKWEVQELIFPIAGVMTTCYFALQNQNYLPNIKTVRILISWISCNVPLSFYSKFKDQLISKLLSPPPKERKKEVSERVTLLDI